MIMIHHIESTDKIERRMKTPKTPQEIFKEYLSRFPFYGKPTFRNFSVIVSSKNIEREYNSFLQWFYDNSNTSVINNIIDAYSDITKQNEQVSFLNFKQNCNDKHSIPSSSDLFTEKTYSFNLNNKIRCQKIENV